MLNGGTNISFDVKNKYNIEYKLTTDNDTQMNILNLSRV
jgi:hypothetical protein